MSKSFQTEEAQKIQKKLRRSFVGKTVKDVVFKDGCYSSPYVEIIFSPRKRILFQYNNSIQDVSSVKKIDHKVSPEALKFFRSRFKHLMRKSPTRK